MPITERAFTFDNVKDRASAVPAGIYRIKAESFDEEHTSQDTHAKLMFVAKFRVVEPAEFENWILRDNFVVGSDEDPECDDPATFDASIGAQRMKELFTKAGVPASSLGQMALALEGQELVATVKTTVTDRGGTFANIQRYYGLGERQPAVATDNGTPASTRQAAPKPAAPAAPKAVETPAKSTVTPRSQASPPPPAPPNPIACAADAE